MPAPGNPSQERPIDSPSDFSPEARRQEAIQHSAEAATGDQHNTRDSGIGGRCGQVIKRVFVGTYNDGTIHAGNLAYMSMLSIFPFFILGAAIFSAVGEESERFAAIRALLSALPPVVADVIRPVAYDVVEQRSGWLLWVGGLFGLWTVGSLVETIRDILRRAYGTSAAGTFWKHRLLSSAIIVGAMILLMISLIAQVTIGAAQEIIAVSFPQLDSLLDQLSLSRTVSALGLFISLYLLFYTLAPAPYRHRRYPKWPGALLVAAWWMGVVFILPPLLRSVFSYSLVYGSLAGIMISLFFFWLVGLGIVMGAELNAALAQTPEEELDLAGHAANR